ncbi:CYTH domain-containing protein [Haloferula luteola]|uniref:CYTH domain-containing protein n=1 Tax=Haloferula luteola TaxID=595692 RepID=A0A840VA40_9BACT|nr:CYTH domain-containing protein [Haloferula luteola]MBB5351548.1 CYTH domain-containing protein [Haloferula luteola]
MGCEIERKFLVVGDDWREGQGVLFRQGYLNGHPDRTVRVRLEGDRGVLTIKGRSEGISRLEFEYPIPCEDAAELLEKLCERPLIEKRRYRVPSAGSVWEVDEFFGENEGLVVAEIELESAEQGIELPTWVGREVSDDPRYFNSNLVKYPFQQWPEVRGIHEEVS